MARNIKKTMALIVIAVAGFACFGPVDSASAVPTSRFLGPDNGGDMRVGISAADGQSVLLDSPRSQFRVFRPQSRPNGDVQVTLIGICTTGKGVAVVIGSGSNQRTAAQIPGDCGNGTGNSNVKFTIPGDNFGAFNKYGGQSSHWRSQVFYVKFNGGAKPAYQPFTVQVSADSKVTFDDLGVGPSGSRNSTLLRPSCGSPTSPSTNLVTIRSKQITCGYPVDNAFSVKPDTGNNNKFILDFKPDCDYTGENRKKVYLKWFDGDYGTDYGKKKQKWELIDLNGSKRVVVQGSDIGGEGSFAYKDIGKLIPGHTYRWKWTGITSGNGVQLWVPFSEMNTQLDCQPPEPPDFRMNVRCDNKIALRDVRDPNRPGANLRYKIWRGDGNGNTVQLMRQGNVNGDKVISIYTPKGRQYITKVFGVNGNGNEDGRDRQRGDRPSDNCPDNPPGDGGGECVSLTFKLPGDSADGQGGADGNSQWAVYVNDGDSSGYPPSSTNYSPNGGPSGNGVYGAEPGPGTDYKGTTSEGGRVTKNLRYDNKIATNGKTLRWTAIVYDAYRASNGAARYKVRDRIHKDVSNCFRATCDVKIEGNVPGRGDDSVKAGQNFTVKVTLTNAGRNNLPSYLDIRGDNPPLSATSNWRGNYDDHPANDNLENHGDSIPVYYDLRAPDDVTSEKLRVYPDYWQRPGGGRLWQNDCTKDIKVFKEFDLDLSADTTLRPTREDPEESRHRASIESDGPRVRVPYSARSTLNGGTINSQGGSSTTKINYSYNHTDFAGIEAGDDYCTIIHADFTEGWVGPNYELADTRNPATVDSCDNVHDRPYLSTYGGDTVAGVGGFYDTQSGSCSSDGDISTFTSVNSAKNRGGSGAQMAAISNGDITGFLSASMTSPALGLSFANTVNNSGGGDNENNLGGQFGQNSCITNYFETTQYEEGQNKNVTSTSAVSPNSLANNKQTLVTPSGTLNISQAINYNKKHTVYVDGNVMINGNIAYTDWESISDIPNFTLVVKGNIYIKPGVTRLDGNYIAQPTEPGDGDSGQIYTCAQSASNPIPNVSTIDSICDTQLTVYGALVSEHINFLRTKNTLRQSKAGENYKDSKAAELIIHSPEIYLSPPVFNTPGSSDSSNNLTIGTYEYITTLPPIL